MKRPTPHGLDAYCALYDVLDAYAGATMSLHIEPDPPNDQVVGGVRRTERGAKGYNRAEITVKLGDAQAAAMGSTIERAARHLLLLDDIPEPLRPALTHARTYAGIQP